MMGFTVGGISPVSQIQYEIFGAQNTTDGNCLIYGIGQTAGSNSSWLPAASWACPVVLATGTYTAGQQVPTLDSALFNVFTASRPPAWPPWSSRFRSPHRFLSWPRPRQEPLSAGESAADSFRSTGILRVSRTDILAVLRVFPHSATGQRPVELMGKTPILRLRTTHKLENKLGHAKLTAKRA